MMKMLVTGASGFLGSHICRHFVGKGHEVTALLRSTAQTSEFADQNIRMAIGDITDWQSVEEAVEGQDAVIHAAAHTAFLGDQEKAHYKVNVEGTQNVVQACKRHKVRRFIHISSIAAVGIPEESQPPANEDFHFNLENSNWSYHISKRLAEEAVLAEAGTIAAVIVNPALIFGPAQGRYQGAQALEKPLKHRLVMDGPGGRCVVHVSDVVDGIARALDRGRVGERYILGGDNVSFRAISKTVCRQLALSRICLPLPAVVAEQGNRIKNRINKAFSRQPLPKYDKRFCRQFYDSTKAKRELGYAPRSFDSIVEECADYLGWQARG
jgi:dihydroflavonol-4-reductase